MEDSGIPSKDCEGQSSLEEHSVNLVENELERNIDGNREMVVAGARTPLRKRLSPES